MLNIEFLNAQDGTIENKGPFDFVQLTYDSLRIGPNGDELAAFFDGMWQRADGTIWSDVTISAVI